MVGEGFSLNIPTSRTDQETAGGKRILQSVKRIKGRRENTDCGKTREGILVLSYVGSSLLKVGMDWLFWRVLGQEDLRSHAFCIAGNFYNLWLGRELSTCQNKSTISLLHRIFVRITHSQLWDDHQPCPWEPYKSLKQTWDLYLDIINVSTGVIWQITFLLCTRCSGGDVNDML